MVNSNLLKTVRFVDTHQWNVKYFLGTAISSKYSLEEIGKHTFHITEKSKLFENPEKEYAILGISNEIGMFDAYTELGKNAHLGQQKICCRQTHCRQRVYCTQKAVG